MSHDRLICPECQFRLTPPSGLAAGMSCPRCNRWVDIDPLCTGGCLSCHKTHNTREVGNTSCGSEWEPIKLLSASEKTSRNVVQSKERASLSQSANPLVRTWRSLFDR